MKLYAPRYYTEFRCIADKCTHSCCIGWEIDIDEDTLFVYEGMEDGYGVQIRNSIAYDDVVHFKLCEGERCPHLDDRGLCRIIKNVGEEFLCEICREHPRFYNDTSRGKEVGIGASCEEAAKIILSSDSYNDMVLVCEVQGEAVEGFDALPFRERIFSILSDGTLKYAEKIQSIYSLSGVNPSVIKDEEWRGIIESLEYLDENHKRLFTRYSSDVKTDEMVEKYLLRATAYFVYRHCAEACDEDDLRRSVGFCLFCQQLFASVLEQEGCESLEEASRILRILSEELEYSEDNTERIKSQFDFL